MRKKGALIISRACRKEWLKAKESFWESNIYDCWGFTLLNPLMFTNKECQGGKLGSFMCNIWFTRDLQWCHPSLVSKLLCRHDAEAQIPPSNLCMSQRQCLYCQLLPCNLCHTVLIKTLVFLCKYLVRTKGAVGKLMPCSAVVVLVQSNGMSWTFISERTLCQRLSTDIYPAGKLLSL